MSESGSTNRIPSSSEERRSCHEFGLCWMALFVFRAVPRPPFLLSSTSGQHLSSPAALPSYRYDRCFANPTGQGLPHTPPRRSAPTPTSERQTSQCILGTPVHIRTLLEQLWTKVRQLNWLALTQQPLSWSFRGLDSRLSRG